MQTNNSRRNFLKTGCLVSAAAGLTLCGGGALAVIYQPEIEQPSVELGQSAAANRVLVTYATKAGSTAETALRIGETLARRGLVVDVLPVSARPDLDSYQSVVLGSAIRMGSILPEAMTFIQEHQSVLKSIPFSLFILCMTLEKDTPENRAAVSAYLDPVRDLVRPASEGLFAGTMDLSKVKLYERLIVTSMKTPLGDFRDWTKIESWAEVL